MTEIARLQIAVDSSGARNATRDIDNMGRAGERSERNMKRLGVAVGTVAAAFAAVGFRAIIRNTIEQERVTAQLEARLRSTGRYTPELSRAMQDFASELQSVTTFGDEAIIGAQALLLSFTKVGGETFPRATKAALDLSTAMRMDLQSATLQVGKALNDPIQGLTALSRAGIQFTDDQKNLIRELVETNRVAEAQSVILGELETQFGGSAEAARNTLGGAIQSLKNAFGDLLEGDSKGDGVRGATQAINDLTDVLSDPNTQQAFATITSAVLKLTGLVVDLGVQFAETGNLIGAWAARLTGNLDALDKIDIQIRRTTAAADKARFSFSRPINMLGKSREELLAEVDALEQQRAAIIQMRGLADFVAPASAGQLVGDALGILGGDEDPKPTPTARGGRDAQQRLRDLAAEEARLLEEIRRRDEAQTAASARFLEDLQSIEAQLAGPMAVAELDRSRRLQEINDALAEGIISEEAATRARDAAEESHRRVTEAIEAQLTPAERLIQDLEFELSLMGLSIVERQKAIALRYAEADAASEQGKAIGDLIEKLDEESKKAAALDDIRQASDRLWVSIIDRSKSAKDAFKSFIDQFLIQAQRAAAARITESLFGPAGSTGGGSLGGIIGAFFGNRSSGGPVMAGVPYRVNEFAGTGGQREVFIPERNGRVEPQRQGRGMTVTNNFAFSGDVDRRSQQQMANEVERSARRAAGRMRA